MATTHAGSEQRRRHRRGARRRVRGQRRARGAPRRSWRPRSPPLGGRPGVVGGLARIARDPLSPGFSRRRAGSVAQRGCRRHHASALRRGAGLRQRSTPGLRRSRLGPGGSRKRAVFGWIDSTRMPLDARLLPADLHAALAEEPLVRASATKRVDCADREAGSDGAGRAGRRSTWRRRPARGRRSIHVDAMVMPPDLKKALAKATPAAAAKVQGALTPGRQKQFLYRLNDAKKDETRTKRVSPHPQGAALVGRDFSPAALGLVFRPPLNSITWPRREWLSHCRQWVEEGEAHDCWTTTEVGADRRTCRRICARHGSGCVRPRPTSASSGSTRRTTRSCSRARPATSSSGRRRASRDEYVSSCRGR